MRPCTHVALGLALGIGVAGAAAEDRRPLREAESENGQFRLQIRPGRPGFDAVRGCKATLYKRTPERHRGRKRWDRFLVNDVAPTHAFIRNDGRFVVTLDEYGCGGARHALAIYGERGELLRHFLLSDLLRPEDWKHVKVDKQSIDWLGGAKFKFVDNPPQFMIALKHGREIRIYLDTLQVARVGPDVAAVEAIPLDILALLFGEEVSQRATQGPELAEMSPQQREEAEALAAEIAARTEPEEPKALPAEEDSGGEPAAAEAVDESAGLPDTLSAMEEPAVTESATEPELAKPEADWPEQEIAEAEVIDAPYGIAIPRPDPAAPFDYLAWVNEMTQSDGPSAAVDYQAAMDRLVPWESESSLQRAAVKGDPQALASGEVQDWLELNREAIAYFRSGAELEFNGWELHSEGGSLIYALLPQLSPMRELGHAAVIEGRSLAAEGYPEDAAESYLDVLAVGAQMTHGVTLIETLVGMAVQKPAAEALLDLQASEAGSDVDYVRLAGRLEEAYQPTRPLAEGVQLERAAFMDTVQNMYDYDPQAGKYLLNEQEVNKFLGLVQEDAMDSVDRNEQLRRQREVGFAQTVEAANQLYDAMTEAMSLPYGEGRDRLAAIDAEVSAGGVISPLTRAMMPSFSRAFFVETRSETVRRAARLATNLQAYRQRYGSYPDSLAVFGERDFAVDPFAGQSFRYRLEGNDFVLYSVGGNGTDDGGLHDPKAESNDYVFWPRPE